MTLTHLFERIRQEFPRLENQKRDIEDIICFRCHLNWGDLYLRQENLLNPSEVEIIWQDLSRLNLGEPTAYILGEKAFFKSNFIVNPGVLIPRPETELLVERALRGPVPKRFADLGAGSGCVGISLAKEWLTSEGFLVETSKAALAVCRANKEKHRLENIEIVEAQVGDSSPSDLGFFDLVVANPPYIEKGDSRVAESVFKYEPHRALFAAERGLACLRSWMQWAERYLLPGGHYIFEFGENQEGLISGIISQTSFKVVDQIDDYQKIPRFFHLEKPKRL